MRKINLNYDDLFNENIITKSGLFVYVKKIVYGNTYPIKGKILFYTDNDEIEHGDITFTSSGTFSAITNDLHTHDIIILGVL